VAGGELAAEIARLKAQVGNPIIAHGAASGARSLIAHGLVDQYDLLVHPVALGKGLPVFSDLGMPRPLQADEFKGVSGGARWRKSIARREHVRDRPAAQGVKARSMMQQSGTAEGRIKAVIKAWPDAVQRHHFSGILAPHEQDIVMFNVLRRWMSTRHGIYSSGIPTRHKRSTSLSLQLSPAKMSPSPLRSCAAAPAHLAAPTEVGGFLFRLTLGL
jgi:hypothetical protein